MLETKCVGDKFEMLVTDSGCWRSILYIEKFTNITKKVTNMMIRPPKSPIGPHHEVTNIPMSPTSLSQSCSLLEEWWGGTLIVEVSMGINFILFKVRLIITLRWADRTEFVIKMSWMWQWRFFLVITGTDHWDKISVQIRSVCFKWKFLSSSLLKYHG